MYMSRSIISLQQSRLDYVTIFLARFSPDFLRLLHEEVLYDVEGVDLVKMDYGRFSAGDQREVCARSY